MKYNNYKIALTISCFLLLTACKDKKEESIKLGFTSVNEMEEIQYKGYKTKKEYEEFTLSSALKEGGCSNKEELEEAIKIVGYGSCHRLKEHYVDEKIEMVRKNAEEQRLNFENKLKKYQVDIEYRRFGDGSETHPDTPKLKYISAEDYEFLCNQSKGLTGKGASVLVFNTGVAQYLYQNGNVDSTDITWNSSAKYKCRASIQVSGMYKGSSARKIVEGGVSTFIMSSTGEILVSDAYEFN